MKKQLLLISLTAMLGYGANASCPDAARINASLKNASTFDDFGLRIHDYFDYITLRLVSEGIGPSDHFELFKNQMRDYPFIFDPNSPMCTYNNPSENSSNRVTLFIEPKSE